MQHHIFQRKLSIALVVILMAGFVPPAEAGHLSGDEWTAYFDDFESYPPGFELDYCFIFFFCTNWEEYPDYVPSRYLFAAEGDNIFVSDPPVATADPLAHFTPRKFDGFLSNSFAGSFHARVRTDVNTSWDAPWLLLADSATIPASQELNWWESSVVIRFGGDGNVYAYGSPYPSLGSYQPNTWVTFDIDFHANGTYDVCMDGKPVARTVSYYTPPTSGIDTIGLWAGGWSGRTSQANWDDLLFSPKPQDFCLDHDPEPPMQDFWNFQGIGDLYSDDQLRMAAVAAFADCTQQVNAARGAFFPYHGCPNTVAEWEDILREKLEDAAEARSSVLPHIERPTDEAPQPIDRPLPELGYIEGVFVPTLTPQDGPALPTKGRPSPVPGPTAPEPLTATPVPGPELVMPTLPATSVVPVVFAPPETPGTTEVVVPLRDHEFDMNWTVSLSVEKLLEMLTPTIPELPVVTGLPFSPTSSMPTSMSPMVDPDDVEHRPSIESTDYTRWLAERNDLVNWLEENASIPDVRDNIVLPPLLFEIHTESRGEIKRTPALPFVPVLINVDNNPTTGLLGLDIVARISFTPLLNEVRMNITRLAPWERNAPDLWEPIPKTLSDIVPSEVPLPIDVELVDPYPGGIIPGTPLDLLAYVVSPIPAPWPVETMLTQNPEHILIGAAGFDTGGNDAPWAMEVAVGADSLLPLNPNSRFTLTMSSWDALDNLTLLGGVADGVKMPGKEHELADLVEPVVENATALVGPLPALPSEAQALYDVIADSLWLRIGYHYEAENATLASVSFQPPPSIFTVDVALPTEEDLNTVVSFESESSTDIRAVVTDERDLQGSPTREIVNVRADKFPTELVVTIHEDPYLPAAQVEYEGEHAIGRLHVATGEHVVFSEDNASWAPGDFPFHLEGAREGTADDVFHLNVSDLPTGLSFRTEDGDVRLEAEAPIGRVAVTAAHGASPILPEGGDGLYYEQDGDLALLGLVIGGVQGFSAITSEPTTTLRWDMVGDQSFAANISLGDDATGLDVRALVSNLPPTLMFATDASSFAALETANAIRNIDAYVIDHGAGFEAQLNVVDLPEALAARFNFTAGELSMDAAQPIGEIRALARLPGSDLSSVRLLVQDLPSFDVSWSIAEENVSATFDASGEGIGLLEFHGGGSVLLEMPSLAGQDHAFLLEDAHPDAPTAIGARMENLQHVSADISPGAYGFRTEHARPEPLTLVLDRPELTALGKITPVPSTVAVRVAVGDEVTAVYEATEVIDRVAMWIWQDTMEGYLDARLIPQRVDVALVNDSSTGGMRGDIRTQGRLGVLHAQVQDPARLFGTPWRTAYARLEGVPEEVTVRVAEGRVGFEATPGALTLVEAAVSDGASVSLLPGDHVRLRGNESGDTVEASARVTGLKFLDATFLGDLKIRMENERARPFTGAVDYPHLGISGVVLIEDLPASILVETNLADRHLYEASSVISRIDAYGKIGTMEAWVGLEDVPARVKVLVNATDDGVEAFVLTSSRLQEARVDVRDPGGIFGTPWKQAYAKVQGLPTVLSFRMDGESAEFGTEHQLIALLEGAATTGDQLYMLEGDHLLYANTTVVDPGCRKGEECSLVQTQLLSFRLRGLEGARATFAPDDLSARLETKDGRDFLVFVFTPDIVACLLVQPLPTIVEFRSDLRGEHIYDATSIISNVALEAQVNGTDLFFGLKDVPRHIHVMSNVTAEGGDVRVWMDDVLRDVLLDVSNSAGLFDTEWQRVRLHIESIPRELKLTFDGTGADFGTGDDQIGLIEFWASNTTSLSELAGDHVRYEKGCASPPQREQPREPQGENSLVDGRDGRAFCDTAVSARLTGLKAARFSMTDEDGLNARLETQGPRVFRALYKSIGEWDATFAQVVVDELPAVLAVRSDMKERFVYEASGIVDEITLRGARIDNETSLNAAARLLGLPARVEVTQSFTADGGSASYVTSSHLGLIEVEVTDFLGIGDTDFTRAVARVQGLPSLMTLNYAPTDGGLRASFGTSGQGIGLVEAGISTGFSLPATLGNGIYLDKGDGWLTATGRIRGFTGASVDVAGDSVSASLQFQEAAPFETIAYVDGVFAYGRIDSVPADLAVIAALPSTIVYAASSPIESIVLYVAQPTSEKIDRIMRADITTIPATMRVSVNEAEGIIHFDASEAIGAVKLQVFDPEMLMGFHNVFAEIQHVPSSMRVKFDGTMQIDLAEGVDSITFQATGVGVYPVYVGEPHAVVREVIDLDKTKRYGVSVKVNGLKFAEVVTRDRFTMAEVSFRESQSLRVYYETLDVATTEIQEYLVGLTNVPKDIKIQLLEAPGEGNVGTILYDASERIGGLEFAMIKSADEYYNLSFSDLPSHLEIDWRFGTDIPWYVRYISDAPTQVHFDMPTSLGPLKVEALVQNLQFSILDVPSLVPDVGLDVSVSLIPPDIDINIELKWTFVIGTDTDFLPNNAKLSLGLFHSDDFDLAVTFTGDLLAQDWLYEASIRVRIGTDTGIDFPIETVGGHAFARLCIGADVRYEPLGIDESFDCVIELGGVFPEP